MYKQAHHVFPRNTIDPTREMLVIDALATNEGSDAHRLARTFIAPIRIVLTDIRLRIASSRDRYCKTCLKRPLKNRQTEGIKDR